MQAGATAFQLSLSRHCQLAKSQILPTEYKDRVYRFLYNYTNLLLYCDSGAIAKRLPENSDMKWFVLKVGGSNFVFTLAKNECFVVFLEKYNFRLIMQSFFCYLSFDLFYKNNKNAHSAVNKKTSKYL